MDKNWRHSLNDRMKDYEEPAPEGLWDSISESPEFARLLSDGDAGTGKPAVSGNRRLWFSLAGGMAAVFALFLLLLKPDNSAPELIADISVQAGNDQIAAKNARAEATNDRVANVNDGMVTENTVIPSAAEESLADILPLCSSDFVDCTVQAGNDQIVTGNDVIAKENATVVAGNGRAVTENDKVDAGNDSQDWGETIEIIENSRERGRWSAGLLASNIPGSSSSSRAGDISFAGMAASGATDFVPSSLADIRTFNTTRETSTSYKHYQPIKVGLSVRYHITRNWSAESGLTYSYLYSKVRYGSEDYYADGMQALHYIGIPLNFNFNIWSNPSLTLYASAGGLMEKCVGGKLRTTSILNRMKGNTDDTDIMVKPLQWSVSASIGLQYNFSYLLGIYLEPGAAYYFNNGSPVETFYSDHPFNFNLELGLRFSF